MVMEDVENEILQDQPQKRKKTKKLLLLFIVLVLAGAAVFAAVKLRQPPNPFPESIRKTTNYSLVYPSRSKINNDSIQKEAGVVSYTVNYMGSVLFVTLQPIPENFNFDEFEKTIEKPQILRTPLGKAVVGVRSERLIGSLHTDDSWVLITATKTTPQSDIEDLLQELMRT